MFEFLTKGRYYELENIYDNTATDVCNLRRRLHKFRRAEIEIKAKPSGGCPPTSVTGLFDSEFVDQN